MISPKTIARSYWIPVPPAEAKYPMAHVPHEALVKMVAFECAAAMRLYRELFK